MIRAVAVLLAAGALAAPAAAAAEPWPFADPEMRWLGQRVGDREVCWPVADAPVGELAPGETVRVKVRYQCAIVPIRWRPHRRTRRSA